MHRALAVFALSWFAAAAALTACGSSASTGSATPSTTVYAPPDGATSAVQTSPSGGGSSSSLSTGAGVVPVPAAVTKGSALCNASPASGCFPDEAPAGGDCDDAPDSGSRDPNATDGAALLGCHVVSDGGVPTRPRAACLAAGAAPEGSSCRASSDCAPTTECVGSGVCRRYCCGDPCDSTHFCDIQPETQSPALLVPVCLRVRTCGLLAPPSDAGPCEAGETCAPVAPSNGVGLTTCVQLGPAHEGDSCEAAHCAANLACIGMWGSKQCYKLCHTSDAGAAECGPEQTCTGGLPLFTDPSIGLCQQLALAVGPDR